jgi:acetoin utilization deacetylase AcuC-like enzyme
VSVALFTHSSCLKHDPGPFHPESPDRLRAVLRALEGPEFASLDRREAPVAAAEAIARAHLPGYIDAVLRAEPGPGDRVSLDGDTHMVAGSVEAARRAAGGAMAAVDAVMDFSARHAFVAVRPPGHHAEAGQAMGFCLFNTVAVAALHARARWGLRRIAVIDFDVHHGNGTQAMFWSDPDLFYGSTHQMPCYPGTGAARERGASGNIVNQPLPPGAVGADYRPALTRVLAELAAFGPELVIASAGFDAHRDDPLAALMLTEDDFAWTAERLIEASGGRLVSVLEGGYDLEALASSVAAYVRVLLQRDAADG